MTTGSVDILLLLCLAIINLRFGGIKNTGFQFRPKERNTKTIDESKSHWFVMILLIANMHTRRGTQETLFLFQKLVVALVGGIQNAKCYNSRTRNSNYITRDTQQK